MSLQNDATHTHYTQMLSRKELQNRNEKPKIQGFKKSERAAEMKTLIYTCRKNHSNVFGFYVLQTQSGCSHYLHKMVCVSYLECLCVCERAQRRTFIFT